MHIDPPHLAARPPVRAWRLSLPLREAYMAPPPTDAIREIAKALRRHVDAETLERVVNNLLDVRGNRDFREVIEAPSWELMLR
jgi:hypothetical protein